MNIQRTNQGPPIGILLEQGKPLRRNIPGCSSAKEPGDCWLVTSMCEEQAEHRDFCAEGKMQSIHFGTGSATDFRTSRPEGSQRGRTISG